MTRTRLSLIVSTVGRVDELSRLVDSLQECDGAEEIELVLVDQSDDLRCATLLEQRSELRFPVEITSSARGLSLGRNVGLRLAHGEIVAFPDDDCWYRPDTIRRALGAFDRDPALQGLSGRQLTADGRPCMLRWATAASTITAGNVHRTLISSTMFIRRELVDSVDGFNEDIGAGSAGWYGAGEDTDLALRLLQVSPAFWYEPELIVHHHEPRDHPTPQLVDKMLRYGCGQGYIWKTHAYSWWTIAYLLLRKHVAAALHAVQGRWMLSNADLAFVHGCVAGLRGRPPKSASALAASDLKRNFVPRVAVAGCGIVCTFALTLLAVRLLDARSATAYAAILTALMVGAMVGRMGLGTNAMLLIAGDTESRRHGVVVDHLSATSLIATLSAPIIALVATTSLAGQDERPTLLVLTAALLVLESIRLTLSDVFAGLGMFSWSIFTTHHTRAILMLLGTIVVAAIGGFTLTSMVVVGLVVGVLTVGAGLFRLSGCIQMTRPSRPTVMLAAVTSGIVLLLVDLASFLVGRGDVWLSAATFPPDQAVRYSTASLLAFQITVPMGLANVALSPIAARMWKERALEDLRNRMDSVAAVAVALTAFAVCVIWTTGPLVVETVYGPALRSAWLPLAILATGTLIFSAWGGSSVLLIVSGHGRQAAVTGIVALAAVVPAAVIVAIIGGPTPLAVASAAATCCLVGSQKWCCGRYVGYAPSPVRGLVAWRRRGDAEPQERMPEVVATR